MQSTPEIEARLAALGQRSESMSILLEMVAGQGERQRRELQQLREAIAAGKTAGATPPDVFVEALGGNSGR